VAQVMTRGMVKSKLISFLLTPSMGTGGLEMGNPQPSTQLKDRGCAVHRLNVGWRSWRALKV